MVRAVIAPLPPEPPAFAEAVAALRAARLRSELVVREIPSPERVAPHALALGAGVDLSGSIHPSQSHLEVLNSPEGAGRFILLYHPEMADEWGGDFRVICYAQAPLEVEIGTDPFVADVAWSWLVDALDSRAADYDAIAGTATKTLSTGYGSLAEQGEGSQIELRASWTPHGGDFGSHLEAWSELLCLLAGLPAAEGVASLGAHRSRRAGQEFVR